MCFNTVLVIRKVGMKLKRSILLKPKCEREKRQIIHKTTLKGYKPYITVLPQSSREIPYWVCLGNFSTYREAEEKLKELNQIIPKKYNIVLLKKQLWIKNFLVLYFLNITTN